MEGRGKIYTGIERWESVIVLSTWTTPCRKTDTDTHRAAAFNRQKPKMAEDEGPEWPLNRTMPGAPKGSSSHKHRLKHTHKLTPFPQMSPTLMRSQTRRSNLSDRKKKWTDWEKTTGDEAEGQAVFIKKKKNLRLKKVSFPSASCSLIQLKHSNVEVSATFRELKVPSCCTSQTL